MMGKQMRDEIYLIQGNLFVQNNKAKKKEEEGAKSEEKKNESNKAYNPHKDNIFAWRKVTLKINLQVLTKNINTSNYNATK